LSVLVSSWLAPAGGWTRPELAAAPGEAEVLIDADVLADADVLGVAEAETVSVTVGLSEVVVPPQPDTASAVIPRPVMKAAILIVFLCSAPTLIVRSGEYVPRGCRWGHLWSGPVGFTEGDK
jgi:hypothetical protein